MTTAESQHTLEHGKFTRWAWGTFLIGGALGTTLPGQLLVLISTVQRLLTRERGAVFSDASTRVGLFVRCGWAFLGASLVSAMLSEYPAVGLANAAGFALLFFVVALGARDVVEIALSRPLRRILIWMLIAGVAGALYGIYSVFELRFHRAEGIAFGPNGFGGLMALLAVFAIGVGLEKRRVGWWLATIPVFLAGLALSMSRGSWLGFVVSLIGFTWLLVRRNKRYLKWTIAVVLGVVLLSSVLIAQSPALQGRLASVFSIERNMDRVLIWRAALEMFKDRPITGVGGGAFPLVYEEYRVEGESRSTISFAHNLPLHILAEYGILGFIPFFALIGLAVVRGWRVARQSGPLIMGIYSGFLGMLVHELFDNVALSMNLGGLFWFLVGFLIHLYERRDEIHRIAWTASRAENVG